MPHRYSQPQSIQIHQNEVQEHTHHRKLTWKSYRKIYGTVLEDDVLLFWCFLPKFLLISDSMSWYSEVWLSLVCQNNWEDDMIGATLFIQTKVPILGSVTVASVTRGHRHSLRDAEVKTIQPSPKDISSGGWSRLRGIGHGFIEKCITYKYIYICWSYIFIDIFNHIYIYISISDFQDFGVKIPLFYMQATTVISFCSVAVWHKCWIKWRNMLRKWPSMSCRGPQFTYQFPKTLPSTNIYVYILLDMDLKSETLMRI